MFKVSEEIYLGASDSANHSKTYGSYQSRQDFGDDRYTHSNPVFVAPEVTEANKVQILHYPETNIYVNKPFEFIVKKNGARGNVQVKLVNVAGQNVEIPLEVLDPDRYLVKICPKNLGVQKLRVFFNTVEIPCSPLPLYVREDTSVPTTPSATNILPKFTSDPSLVRCHGFGISSVSLNERNEFIVDGSKAGNNILFVGVVGPRGQCDNLAIKHLGQNIYNVSYAVKEQGQYVIMVKWGDDHIPGSPFRLTVFE